jgi:hypothetical protein
MSALKIVRDHIIKALLGSDTVPRELLELHDYFRLHGPINFRYEKEGDTIVAISTNFRFGSIVTSGKNLKELDENIKDAILTSFELPSAYEKEAKLYKEGNNSPVYALA